MKYLAIVGISILAYASLTSCKLEGEDIGDLYGRWHLHTITSDAGLVYEPDTVYLSFMAQVYQYQPNWQYDWGTYERRNDSLTLNPLAYQSAFGFRDLMHNSSYDGMQSVSFLVRQLSNKEMTLQRSDTLWYFKKYME